MLEHIPQQAFTYEFSFNFNHTNCIQTKILILKSEGMLLLWNFFVNTAAQEHK
jgi:hypothetical protein